MKYNNNKVFTCFFSFCDYIICTVFNLEDNFTIINTSKTITKDFYHFNEIKSTVITNDGRQKAIICGTVQNNGLFCAGYNIITNTFIENLIKNNNF